MWTLAHVYVCNLSNDWLIDIDLYTKSKVIVCFLRESMQREQRQRARDRKRCGESISYKKLLGVSMNWLQQSEVDLSQWIWDFFLFHLDLYLKWKAETHAENILL